MIRLCINNFFMIFNLGNFILKKVFNYETQKYPHLKEIVEIVVSIAKNVSKLSEIIT